ncbi:hypothetical protein Thermo_00265 [Thermoplasmatales archaeon]|nr:hypothetical protein Thermo_00265 [Thermoplasmatales archaeon]
MHLRKVWYFVIVVGIVLVVSGVAINPYFHNISSSTITTAKFSQLTHYDNGFYETIIPSNMTAQITSIDVAVNPTSNGPGNVSLLVPVKDLSSLNYSNVQKLGIKPSNNDSADIYFNSVPVGSYAFVESQNNSLGMSIVPEIPLDIGGTLTFVGTALILSGFVIIILSFAIGRRNG